MPWRWPRGGLGGVMRVEDRLFGEPRDVMIRRRVEDPVAIAAGRDEAGQTQLGQVLRNGSWLRADVFCQIVDRVLSVDQRPDDPEAGGIREQLQRPRRLRDLFVRRLTSYLRSHVDRLPGCSGQFTVVSPSGHRRVTVVSPSCRHLGPYLGCPRH